MKKVLFTIAAAVMMLAATSCKKENVNEPENFNREPEAYEFLATVGGGMQQNAPAVNDGMSTMATFDPETLTQVMWQIGDVINVNGETFTCTTDPAGTNRAYFENPVQFPNGFQATQYHALYSTTLESIELIEAADPTKGVKGMLSATQTYNPDKKAENLPMYATSTDHWLNFNNICAALKIYAPVSTANKIILTTTEPITGQFEIRENGVFDFIQTGDGHNTITITKPESANFINGEEIFIAVPGGTYHGLNITFYNGDNQVWTTGTSSKDLTVTANRIYKIGFNLLTSTKFTINGQGDQVQFTKGNLYYDRVNHIYALEESPDAFATSLDANHISHFFFCDDVNFAAADSYSSTHGGNLFCDENHKISVNGIDGLYNLSKTEWEYILNHSNHAHDTKLNCLIIAPDGVTDIPTDKTIKEYSDAGYLCLPNNASYRDGTTLYVGTTDKVHSRYWTSTPSENAKAYQFDIKSTYQSTSDVSCGSYGKNLGRNIRLAKKVTR